VIAVMDGLKPVPFSAVVPFSADRFMQIQNASSLKF